MACKHRQVIRITNNKQEYYCTAKQREIKEWECNNCLLKLEENPYEDLIDLFLGGFKKWTNIKK